MDVLFALGVMKATGPRLTVVGSVGGQRYGCPAPLYWVMMSPFEQEVAQLGYLRRGDDELRALDLTPLLGMCEGECPTIVWLHQAFTEEARRSWTALLLEGFADVGEVHRKVVSCFGDPWERMEREADGGLAGGGGRVLPRRAAAEELAEVVSRAEHNQPEMEAFLAGWGASIERNEASAGEEANVFYLPFFLDFLASCVLPSVAVPKEEEA